MQKQIKKGDTWVHEETTLTAVSDGYMKAVGQQGQSHQFAMVKCSCGSKPFECAAHRLRSKKTPTKSCKCLQKKATSEASSKQYYKGHKWKGKYTTLTAMCDGYMKPGEDGKRWRYIIVQCSCADKTEWEALVYGLGRTTTSCGCATGKLVADAQREPVRRGTIWRSAKATMEALCDGYYVFDAASKSSKQWVRIRCSCKKEKPMLVSNLQPTLKVLSCGCVHSEQTSALNAKRNSRDGFRGLDRWIYRSRRKLREMMSVWELAVAHTFDTRGIKWIYERKWFKLRDGVRYLPDFYLPETNEWYEVKAGWGGKLEEFELTKAMPFRVLGERLTVLTDENGTLQGFVGLSDHGMRRKYTASHWKFQRSRKGWVHVCCGALVTGGDDAVRKRRWKCPKCDRD